MAAEFEKRRNFVVYKLQSMPRVSCPMPRGAFYAFPSFQAFIEEHASIRDDVELAGATAEKYRFIRDQQLQRRAQGPLLGKVDHLPLLPDLYSDDTGASNQPPKTKLQPLDIRAGAGTSGQP